MKKRILSALLAIMICLSSTGVMAKSGDLILSDTTRLNMENTDTCFAKATDKEYHAGSNYYMHFASSGDWLEVTQNLTEGVAAGGQYVITVVAKPVSGRVWFRIGWDDTGWLMSEQTDLATDLGDGWYRYVKEVTLTADQASFLFHNDGAAEMYIDSISLKPVSEDKELIPNGGFDSVTYDAQTGVILANNTTVNVANTDTVFARMIREEIPAENEYSLHLKTGAGDWLEVTQNLTETATAGSQYVFTAYIKPVTGTVWFRLGWDDTAWMISTQEGSIGPDGWTRIEKVVTMTADQTNLLFHNDGETEIYIDDISLVAVGGTENLIPDGGFGEVIVEGFVPEVGIPDEDLILSDKTTVNVTNTDTMFAKVTDNEKYAGEYSLHFKAPASGWLEVSQRLNQNTATGEKYIISANVKAVSGRVWFRLGWDDTAWMIADSDDVGTEWTYIEKEVTIAGNDNGGELNTILFHNDQGEGDAEFYIDNLSVVKVGEETGLVPDGGFEDVTVEGEPVTPEEPPVTPDEPTVDIPDEDLILSDKTTVNVTNTDTMFAKVTDNEKYAGEYSLHFKAPASDRIEVSQRLNQNTATGEKYIISANVKAVSGRVWFRLGWDDTAWMVADSDDVGTEWTYIEKEVTIAGNDNGGELNTILFHNDQGEGDAEFYIDNLSVVKVGEETELVPDGGFEDVTVEGEPGTPDEPTVDIPDEDLILSETTRINADAENCYAKVTDNKRNSGNYSLHLYTEGDWLEIAQNYTAPLTAGTYTLTWYAKGEGRIWFYSNWGTEFAATHSVDSAEVQANGWTKYTRTLNIDGDGDVSFLFHGEGAVNQYIDDISLVDANGVNYIIDGGFEEVTVFKEIVLPEKSGEFVFNSTRVNANADNCYAEPANAVKHSGEYSMHLYTEGDWLEIGQDYTAPLTAGTYTLTWYAVGEGTIWFYSNWGTEFAATHAVDSAEEQADGWTKYTRTLNIDGEGDTSFLFHTDGSANVCIDDVSLVDANGVNYIADGGFEDIKPVCCTGEHIWDEGVVTLEPTEEAEGIRTYSCTVCTQTKTEAIEKLPVVPEYRLGDTNGDGEISVKDVVPIRRTIAGGYTVEMNEAAADVNQDGTISVKDVVPIRRFIAGGYGVEL